MNPVSVHDKEEIDLVKKNLLSAYHKCGMTPYRLSREAGITENAVKKILFENAYPRLDTFIRLCNAMDVPGSEMFLREIPDEEARNVQMLIQSYLGIEDEAVKAAARHMMQELEIIGKRR